MWPGVVASRGCEECSWKVHDLEDGDLVRLIGGEGPAWTGVLQGASAAALRWRPAPDVWTGLEYAAHVRGVLEVFGARVDPTTGDAFTYIERPGGAFNPAVAVGASLIGLLSWSNIWIYLAANFAAGAAAQP